MNRTAVDNTLRRVNYTRDERCSGSRAAAAAGRNTRCVRGDFARLVRAVPRPRSFVAAVTDTLVRGH